MVQMMKWFLSVTRRFRWTGYMLLKLKRLESNDNGIFGHLTMDGFDCVTLENHSLSIPSGTYKVTLYDSPIHGCLVPWIHVPGREYIEIHWGNWERDSKGCVLVGLRRDGDCIENSQLAFATLMDKLKGINEMEINIS